MKHYDVFVIGTGTAGQVAAGRLAEAGKKVGIADEREYGGTCSLRGCQPKKFFVVPAHAALEGAGLTARGFTQAPQLDWATMRDSRAAFTDAVPEGTRSWLSSLGVDCLDGPCEFLDPRTIAVGDEEVTADTILIATGARPRPLAIPGGDLAVTSDEFLYLDELPRRVAFIGGGFISMEFASVVLASGGEAHVFQRGEHILPRFDQDMVEVVLESYRERSAHVVCGASPVEIARTEEGFYLSLKGTEPVTVDLVVAAAGRIPNVDDLGLDAAGVNYGPRGIAVSPAMRTNVPHIYALGDCAAGIQLSPLSDLEARTAAAAILGDPSADARPPVLPSVVFTSPELATVGLGEEEARQARGEVKVMTARVGDWATYSRYNESHAAFKTIVSADGSEILGAHFALPRAGELANLVAVAMAAGMSPADLAELPLAYPTQSSDLKYMFG